MATVPEVQRLIEMGYFNYPGSTEVDIEMAERAIESAIHLDAWPVVPAGAQYDPAWVVDTADHGAG